MSEEGSGTSAIFDAETGTLALEAFIASLKAVLQAFVVAAAGMWMTRRGILKPEVIGAFSKLSMKVTLPCKLFTSMLQHAKDASVLSAGVGALAGMLRFPVDPLCTSLPGATAAEAPSPPGGPTVLAISVNLTVWERFLVNPSTPLAPGCGTGWARRRTADTRHAWR